IRAGGDEGLNLSWTDRSAAGIVDSTVGCGKWIRSAVPISCEGQVSGLAEGKHNVSDILELVGQKHGIAGWPKDSDLVNPFTKPVTGQRQVAHSAEVEENVSNILKGIS